MNILLLGGPGDGATIGSVGAVFARGIGAWAWVCVGRVAWNVTSAMATGADEGEGFMGAEVAGTWDKLGGFALDCDTLR